MRTFIYDDVPAEANAMLQALYSRSSDSVKDHLDIVRKRGADKFMASYYVGYGHASIGDCGQTTMFIEDISLLACKTIQDNPLYSGQETSTRYIDFSQQNLVDPTANKVLEPIQKEFIDFYLKAYEETFSHLQNLFPYNEDRGCKEKVWNKTLQARAFDIARGFLPAGVTSQLAWTGSLREAQENVDRLIAHPLSEVQEIGQELANKLKEKYDASFDFDPANKDRYQYKLDMYQEEAYITAPQDWLQHQSFDWSTTFDPNKISFDDRVRIENRPRKAYVPRRFMTFGTFDMKFKLDFGSYRDLQRHRNGYCGMPLLTNDLGFHDWYINQLPEGIQQEATDFINTQVDKINDICQKNNVSKYDRQYALPLGMNVYCHLVYDLPQMIYVTELRSNTTVHATLREVAKEFHKILNETVPNIAMYTDLSEDALDARRGTQDIEKVA